MQTRNPIIPVRPNICPKRYFKCLIHHFSLPVGLGVISRCQSSLHSHFFAYFLSEFPPPPNIPVRNDLSGNTILGNNVTKEKLSSSFFCNCSSRLNEYSVFGEFIHNN